MKRWIPLFLRSLFCSHTFNFVRNIYGDEIDLWRGGRSLWVCENCGHLMAIDTLVEDSK